MPGPNIYGREYIPDGTKVIKDDGTLTYYKDLERHEVPDYIITGSSWEKYKGWKCIPKTKKVETEDRIICEVGDVPIGKKIIDLNPVVEEPSKGCTIF